MICLHLSRSPIFAGNSTRQPRLSRGQPPTAAVIAAREPLRLIFSRFAFPVGTI
jgi:hypothetical protein